MESAFWTLISLCSEFIKQLKSPRFKVAVVIVALRDLEIDPVVALDAWYYLENT